MAAPQQASGNPPEEVHFAEEPVEQPPFRCWITGHSQEYVPVESDMNTDYKQYEYDYAHEEFCEQAEQEDQDYYYGEEE